ncbi:MAG: hypothetical protein ACE3L7_01250 [Candidatus Pristimantibacillus sp.]
MAFKPIDLQVSIPRTPEVSGIQSQANHKAIAEQTRLADLETKQMELMRSKNAGVEHSVGLNVRKDQEGQQSMPSNKKKRKDNEEPSVDKDEAKPPEHPYKGHHFDRSL